MSETSAIKRHPLNLAFEQFKIDEKECFDPGSLGSAAHKYFENRLFLAFMAGANAENAIMKADQMIGKVTPLVEGA